MRIEDLYAAIPNHEEVDKVFINAVFKRLMNLKRMTEMINDEEIVFVETTREGNPKTVKNPFWDVYRNEMAGTMQNLAELNLTPRSRKTLMAKLNKGGMPDLG